MDIIEAYARLSVARGCGFALLAIVVITFGLLGSPAFALKIAGISCLLVAVFLLLRSNLSQKVNYRNTEVWLMLEVAERPPAAIARRVIPRILGRIFAEFGVHFAIGAASFLGAAFIMQLALR